jgi:cytochrome c-type biogenesis protein CcmE
VEVPVLHHGDPPEMFKPGIPVVLEGQFQGGTDTFSSDRILVKHSETYIAENPDRVQSTAP